MRVCPKCGYEEGLLWRNAPHTLWTQYCTLEELKDFEPDLYEIIASKKHVIIANVIYHVTRSNHVQRIHCKDSQDGKSAWEPKTEKSHAYIRTKGQMKLTHVFNIANPVHTPPETT
jgi:hypothetical protein